VAKPIPKVPAFFGASKGGSGSGSGKALPPGVTHLLCGVGDTYKHRSPSSILSEVGVASLPPPDECKVVAGGWLTECIQKGARVAEGPYLIDMTAPPPPPPPPPPAPPLPTLKRDAAAAAEAGSGSAGGKRPRPSSRSSSLAIPDDEGAAPSALPPPPPLLAGQEPQPVPGLSPKIPMNHTWVKYPMGLLHLKVNGGHPPAGQGQQAAPVRIAAFDLDSTLVKTRSGAWMCRMRWMGLGGGRVTCMKAGWASVVIEHPMDLDPYVSHNQSTDPSQKGRPTTPITTPHPPPKPQHTTHTGKTFPTSPSDWQWQYPPVAHTLHSLHGHGHHLYLLSNQKGITTKSAKLTYTDLTLRVSAVVAALGLPEGARVEGFFATHDNVFYKPRPGMWYLLEDKCVLCVLCVLYVLWVGGWVGVCGGGGCFVVVNVDWCGGDTGALEDVRRGEPAS
jgi:DNA 3'-phosphatase